MRIAGLQKTTLVDYPGKVAATVFTQGCNFRCPYCHNPELVIPAEFAAALDIEEFFNFLHERQGKLEAVCITGGEPTIQAGLLDFIVRIKELDFLVKLDTNGSRPDLLEKILADNLVDYVAMDIKAPLDNYGKIANIPSALIPQIERSIQLLMHGDTDYEFRTTVVKPLHSLEDFTLISRMIANAKRYFIQNYQATKILNDEGLEPFSNQELLDFQLMMQEYVEEVGIR